MGGVRYREKFRLLFKKLQFIKNKFNVHPGIKKNQNICQISHQMELGISIYFGKQITIKCTKDFESMLTYSIFKNFSDVTIKITLFLYSYHI